LASEKRCGRRRSGRWASRCQWRRSRTMVFGLQCADENDVLRRRDGLACQQRRTNDFCRRRRHRRHQHHATDAAIIDAMLVVGIAGSGRLVAGDKRMADDAARSDCRSGRDACRAKTRNQARQRNRISRRQRNNAPPQRPSGEIRAHGASPGQSLDHITKPARLSLHEPGPARFIPVTETSVQRWRKAAGVSAARPCGGPARRARFRPIAPPARRAAPRPASANAPRGPFPAWRVRRRRSNP